MYKSVEKYMSGLYSDNYGQDRAGNVSCFLVRHIIHNPVEIYTLTYFFEASGNVPNQLLKKNHFQELVTWVLTLRTSHSFKVDECNKYIQRDVITSTNLTWVLTAYLLTGIALGCLAESIFTYIF